jgi:AcrR family transcriptional regulator
VGAALNRSRLEPAAQRERIVDAAARLLRERPFADVTVERLREDLGLSKGGLYHHVPSKAAILLLVCEHAGEAMLAAIDEAQSLEGTPRKQLELLLDRHLDLVDRYGGAMWAFFSERDRMDATDRERVLQWERRYVGGVVALLDDAKAAGELRDVDTTVVAHCLIGVGNWITRWYRGRPSRDDLRAIIATTVFDGVFRGAPPDSV